MPPPTSPTGAADGHLGDSQSPGGADGAAVVISSGAERDEESDGISDAGAVLGAESIGERAKRRRGRAAVAAAEDSPAAQ